MTQKSMCERTRSCIVVSALALSLSAGVIVALSSPAAATPRDDRVNEIRELIDRGELARAHALMSELATVTNRSPGELLQRARLESNGPAVEEYLSAALTSASYKRAKERIYLTLALYFQARADLVKLKSILKDYFGEFGRGQYAEEMSQLKIYLSERSSDLSEARRLNRRLEQSSARAATREWAKLNVARYGLENSSSSRNAREARRSVVRLSSSTGSAVAPLALYLLATHEVSVRDFDQAALNFNILREAYPHAIGGYDLIELISEFDPERPVSNGEAERLLGSYYSVQVGVFSEKRNAKRQSERFEPYGQNVDMARKTISGKQYYAVYVGRFDTADEAAAFKKSLERSEKELFTITLRQK